MKILCVFGEHNYGDPKRGAGYEYTNFIPAFRRLGHEVVFFESFSRTCHQNFFELNCKFLETIENEKPDVIFCVLMGYEIWTETLARVRDTSDAILMNWATDDSWKFDQFSRFLAPYFHIYATTYPEAVQKAKKYGWKNVVLTQWAANPEKMVHPVPAKKCRWPVTFVGMAYGNRPKWIARLKAHGIQVDCFGYGWKNGAVDANDIPNIVHNSAISLNFGDSDWVLKGMLPCKNRQIKARIFEVPGYGGFLISQPAEHLESYFRIGEEIVLFEGVKDLVDKINYYLNHPQQRDNIAWEGYNRTLSEHTYDKRFEFLLKLAEKKRKERSGNPIQVNHGIKLSPGEYDRLETAHAPGRLLKLLKYVFLKPCVAIWGRNRGFRAARRILFELSWRLAGKKTYSATGWPGRLFYKES